MKDTRKIFLPLTLDNSTKTQFSGKQLFGFCAFFLLIFAWQIAIIQIGELTHFPKFIMIIADIMGTWLLIFMMRKIVLKENQMIKQYQQYQNLQKTDLSFIWNIFSIRDNHIYYCNGMQAVIVELTHGYLLDRPADQEQIHRDTVKTAIGNLTKQGYKFIYLNREVKDSNLEPLMKTEHQLYQFKDTSIYDTANQIIRHTFNVCSRIANTEQEYYVIFADTMDTIKKLDHAAKEFLDTLHGGIYVKMDILDDSGIWDFIAKLYGISYINTAELLSQKFEDNQLPLVSIIDVVRDKEQTKVENEPASDSYPQQSTQQSWDVTDELPTDLTDDEGDFL